MKKLAIPIITIITLLSACVSKKKYVELENKYVDTRGNLLKLQTKFENIEGRIDRYNKKINALKDDNINLNKKNSSNLEVVGNKAVISKEARTKMIKTLEKMDPKRVASAKSLKDSMNLALSYNIIKGTLGKAEFDNSNDIEVGIDQTVVMISISDKLLFNSGSYKIKKSAIGVLTKIADLLESEPSIDVMVEGHTDSKTINNSSVQDNWDLSVKRATSIVRILQQNFKIKGERLIASGRGDTMPLVPNTSQENRARNRRTRIVLMPNLDKFFALMAEEGVLGGKK